MTGAVLKTAVGALALALVAGGWALWDAYGAVIALDSLAAFCF